MTNIYISPELMQGYHGQLASYSPATQDRKMSSLNNFFNWAVDAGHMETNPLTPQAPIIMPDTPQKKSNLIKNTLRFGILSALVVFILLLAWRLKIPFEFIPSPAAPTQEVAQASPSPSASGSEGGLTEKDPFLSQIYQNGVLTLEGLEPALKAIGGLLIQSEYITIATNDNSDGDITLNPDGSGNLNLLFEGTSGNQVNAQSANLTSGSLYYGYIANNSGSPYLIKLDSGSSPVTQFSVRADGQTFINGNTQIDANLNITNGNLQTNGTTRLTSSGRLDAITGFDQYSGNFQITQGPPDWMNIDKELDGSEGLSLTDSVTFTFSETNPSDYDTLVLKRSGGTSSSYALYIDQGNALIDENLTIGGDLAVNGGDITSSASTFNLSIADGGTTNFKDGSTTLFAIKDQGTYPFLGLAGKANTGDPATCSEGDIYYNAFDDSVKICHSGNSWEALDGGGSVGGFTEGSVIFAAADGTLTEDNASFFWDDALNKLSITGDLDISDQAAFGSAGAITSQQVINVNHVFTDTTGSSVAVNVLNQVEPGSAASGNYYGTLSQVRLDTAFNPNTIRGVGALATINAAATASTVQGLFTQANISNAIAATVSTLNSIQIFADAEDATVTNSSSARIEMPYVDTGTIGSGGTGAGYGINITDGVKGTGSIDTQYGIFLGSLANGNTNYGIWGNNGDWILDEDGDGVAGSTTSGGGNIMLGEGQDLELYHNGTASFILNNTGILTIGAADGSSIDFTDGTTTLVQMTDQGSTGRLAISDSLQVGSLTTAAYSRLGTGTTSHSGNLTASNDLLISGDLEVDGIFYLDGGTLSNFQGTAAMVLCSAGGVNCVTTSEIENTLSSGTWVVQNTANVGKAALIVSQTKDGDIFTASDSATPKFTVKKDGTVVGNTSVGLRLQTGGTTPGVTGNSSVFFLDSTGTIRGRFDTATSGLSFGTSKDGNVEINSAKNLNTTTIATGRNFADGIAYRVIAPADSATTVTRHSGSVDLTNGIAVGDEVLLINLQGASGDTTDVGNYEFMRVSAITASTITFSSAITKSFDGTTASNQKVVVQRVPNYDSVRIFASGSLTASAWDELATTPTGAAGYYTGTVAFRAGGTVTVESGGSISTSNLGYQGYVGADVLGPRQQGASYPGAGTNSDSANGGGGGGGGVSAGFVDKGGGGGGGYAASGDAGTGNNVAYQGDGGGTYGSATLSTLFFGSGGGTSYNNSTAGDGGGIMFIAANTISSTGTIISNGQNGTTGTFCGTGGGAGGSIYLVGGNITIGTTTASGGTGSTGLSSCASANGGNASVGRIRIEYTGTLSGTTTPAASTATSITSGVQSPSLLSTSYGTLYTGAVNTSSADVAEHYPSKEALSPGEVVIFDSANQFHIKRATQAYDPTLAGIISTNPGVILGQSDSQTTTTYPLALSGRVPVLISPASEEIAIGDFLTSSPDPGRAMKATKGGPIIGQALEDWSPLSGNSQINVFVELGQIDPLMAIGRDGQVYIHPIFMAKPIESTPEAEPIPPIAKFELRDIVGSLIERLDAYSDLIVANLRAGKAEVEILSPVPEKDLVIDLSNGKTASESGFGRLIVKGRDNKDVTSIDAEGNATFAGTVNSDKLAVDHDATVGGDLYAGRIVADEVIASKGSFGLSREEIEAMLSEAVGSQEGLIDTDTSLSTSSQPREDLASDNLYVTGIAAVNSLSVTTSITLGNDLVIQSSLAPDGSTISSIDSLSAPLSIQSLAMAPLRIMAGLVTINTNGDVVIGGNLDVAGTINSSGLALQETDQSPTASGFAKLLALYDTEGSEVASIDASGSAQFADVTTGKVVIAGSEAVTTSSFTGLTSETNATAGTTTLPAGSREITIKNPNVTDLSLVYVTPITTTQNKVLYVKSKEAGSFTVGLDDTLDIDVKFNWWVIDVTIGQ